MTGITYIFNDGGRSEAGYSELARDCVIRAIAIASGSPYLQVKADLEQMQATYASQRRTRIARKLKERNSSIMHNGVHKAVYEPYILSLGFQWVPTMQIGSGAKVHLSAKELPEHGTLICRVSKHLCAVIDGKLYDTHDCSRNGRRCVYGYWYREAVGELRTQLLVNAD